MSYLFTQFSTLAKTHTTTAREPSIYSPLRLKMTKILGKKTIVLVSFQGYNVWRLYYFGAIVLTLGSKPPKYPDFPYKVITLHLRIDGIF